MNRRFLLYFVVCLGLILLAMMPSKEKEGNKSSLPMRYSDESTASSLFSLQPGDILARPNISWFPGSSEIESGRNFGHAAIVVEGAEGRSIREVLGKAVVVEAFIFDQASRGFVFGSTHQTRRASAIVSFGSRFRGIRYRLRMSLSDVQRNELTNLARDRVDDGRYALFVTKSEVAPYLTGKGRTADRSYGYWNCASFVWVAYLAATGVDVDANGGELIYPNDLINSPAFDGPGGRCRF